MVSDSHSTPQRRGAYSPPLAAADVPVRRSFVRGAMPHLSGAAVKVYLHMLDIGYEMSSFSCPERSAARATGLARNSVSSAIQELLDRRLILLVRPGTKTRAADYQINAELAIEEPEATDKTAANASRRAIGYVYLMLDERYGYHKIGCSKKLQARLRDFSRRFPALRLIHSIETDDQERLERAWHERAADYRVKGEWFALPDELVRAFLSFATVLYGKVAR